VLTGTNGNTVGDNGGELTLFVARQHQHRIRHLWLCFDWCGIAGVVRSKMNKYDINSPGRDPTHATRLGLFRCG